MYSVELGIDTLSYYCGLTQKQKDSVIGYLKVLPGFRTERQDYWEKTYVYHSSCFAKQGVKLVVSQIKGKPWGLLVVVHPTLVLGISDRSALYQPTKKREYKDIVKEVDQLLRQANVPCSVEDMKLYRGDVTANLVFKASAEVDEYIRILKKSCSLPHYKREFFRKDDHKAKDYKTANRHSCKQVCKSAAFFAYDKTAQLEMIDAFPGALIGKRVLRLEAQLRRKAMKKWVGKNAMDSSWEIISALYKNTVKILNWYLKRIQPVKGEYLRYQDVADTASQVKGKKLRERMLCLLRKTSDSESLTAALEKLRGKYGLSKSQCNTVLKKFKKLKISPITLTNSSNHDGLPPLQF